MVEGGLDCNNYYCNMGSGIAAAGDVNGDGYDDVIVASGRWSNGQNDEGRAFVYYGSAAGLRATADWSVESNQFQAYLGPVGTAGDVNGDGYDDIIVSATRFDGDHTNEGRAFVFLGSAAGLSCGAGCPVDATTAAAWTAESHQANAELGFPVGTAGDVNGDGYDDVLVGAHLYDGAFTDEGKVWVYLGSASGLANTAAWSVMGGQASARLGPGSGAAGDVNGDGFDDVLVAAHLYDNGQADEGRVLPLSGLGGGVGRDAGLERGKRSGRRTARLLPQQPRARRPGRRRLRRRRGRRTPLRQWRDRRGPGVRLHGFARRFGRGACLDRRRQPGQRPVWRGGGTPVT